MKILTPESLAAVLPLALWLAASLCAAQSDAETHDGKPVLSDPSASDSGLDYFSQGGVVVDGIAYFTADQSCSRYWKADGYPFGVAFDVSTFRKVRTYPLKDTYDSCPLVVQKRDGSWLIIAHEYKEKRTVALERDTAEVVWTSPANQPGSYFFGHSYYVLPGGARLIFAASQNGLHALSGESGEEVWWVRARSTGGVTPCVDQQNGWVYYQPDGKLIKIRAADGEIIKSVPVGHPNRTVSWNTVLARDAHGYHIATYWFGFVDRDGKKKMQWNAAVRVHDAELNLLWERTGLPCPKKATLTYADGKLVVGTGSHWSPPYEGTEWKYIAAYAIGTGDMVWKCDLTEHDYRATMNVPYGYGFFYAEAWAEPAKLFKINAATGVLEDVYEYDASVSSCAPPLIAHGRVFSGDLGRDGIVVTRVARNSTSDWPGPFCDPQTNTYALPDDPNAQPTAMEELYVGIRGASTQRHRRDPQ
ncbi:MAG: PQQ-binding-like beta-propeller repeat protein [Armatimonadota bacterium]|jgi:hypothetical protein